MRTRLMLAATCAALLNACTMTTREPGAGDLARAQAMRPADAALSERYETTPWSEIASLYEELAR